MSRAGRLVRLGLFLALAAVGVRFLVHAAPAYTRTVLEHPSARPRRALVSRPAPAALYVPWSIRRNRAQSREVAHYAALAEDSSLPMATRVQAADAAQTITRAQVLENRAESALASAGLPMSGVLVTGHTVDVLVDEPLDLTRVERIARMVEDATGQPAQDLIIRDWGRRVG